MKKTCETCGGRGRVKYVLKGRLFAPGVSAINPVDSEGPCYDCLGTGEIEVLSWWSREKQALVWSIAAALITGLVIFAAESAGYRRGYRDASTTIFFDHAISGQCQILPNGSITCTYKPTGKLKD